MDRIVALVLALGFSGAASVQDLQDFKVRVQTRDGSSFVGTAKLPASVAIKTKFGDVKVQLSMVSQILRTPDSRFRFEAGAAGTVVGEWTGAKIELVTAGGKLEISEADLQMVTFENPAPAASAPVAAPVAGAKKSPLFKGYEVRKPTERSSYAKLAFRSFDPVVLLPGGRQLALLDYETEECVFVELATGACKRIKVESAPTCLIEKGGKVYVANSKSNSLSIIDAKSQAPAGRIALGSAPSWITAPVVGNVLYVVTRSNEATFLAVDTQANRVIGPLVNAAWDRPINLSYTAASVTPDNRILIAQGNESHSPSCRPDVFLLNGLKCTQVVDPRARLHTDHGGAYLFDFTGARLYTGWYAYSLDMSERIGEFPCIYAVAHPTKGLVLGLKKGQYRVGPSDTVVVLDEGNLTQVCEIPAGDDLVALVPVEETLYAVSATQVYPIPLSGKVPAASLSKAKARRIPVDLANPPSEADVKKAQAVLGEGQRALDGGKFEEAKKKFEAALQLDPLSNAKAGLGMLLVRQKKYSEAVDFLTPARVYPFRDPAGRSIVYNQLGIAYAEAGQTDNAIRTFQEGLRASPKDTTLLKNLGVAFGNSGKLTEAYIMWAKCLQVDSRQSDVKKMLDETLKKIAASTTAKCEICEGDGKFEAVIQEQGSRKKVITECKTCKGCGKTWRRPCVDCQATGRKDYYTRCDKCWSGYLLEPAKGTY